MSEQPYPISCKTCGKQLFGPVTYCPYCGIQPEVTPAIEPTVKAEEISKAPEPMVQKPVTMSEPIAPMSAELNDTPPVKAQMPAPDVKIPEQIIIPAPENKSAETAAQITLQTELTQKPSYLKWVTGAVVIVICIALYFVFNNDPVGPNIATKVQGKKESARIVAADALSQGTNLSLTISKLPKLEKVLQAAKQLGDISPRYQEQIVSAESSMSAARSDRDKSLMSYIRKIVELGRYTPDQVSYAMGVIQSGDISSREKIVVELLATHVSSLRNNTKADAKKMLSDFNQRFSDFVD